MTAPVERPQIGSLTSVRFPAALHVVLFHYGLDFIPSWARSAVWGAHATLPLFFVLSGFILVYNYGGAFEEQGLTRRSFHLARFARIYPLYGALVLFELALMLGPTPAPDYVVWPATLAHLFMLQGFFREYFHYGNVPGWSIGAEAFFYYLFPWIQRLTRSDSRPALYALMTASWCLEMAIAGTAYYRAPLGVRELVFSAPIVILPEFVFGVALGWLYRLDLRDGRRLPGDALVILSSALIFVFTVRHDLVPDLMMQNGFIAPLYGLLVYGLSHGGRISRFLSHRPLVVLGELSYAIYLLQVPVYQAFALADAQPSSGVGIAVYMAVLVAVSFVTYFAFERPLQRMLRRGALSRLAARPDRARDHAWLVIPASVAGLLVAMQLGVLAPFGRPVLGAEPINRIIDHGFHGPEVQDGKPFRWTTGVATVRLPIDRRPASIRITLGPAPRPDTGVRISLNRVVRYEGLLPEEGLSRSFSLKGISVKKALWVTIESTTFVPKESDPANGDTRVLGVTLFGLELED